MIPSSIIEGFEAKQNNRYSLTNKDLSSIKNFFSSQEYISITNLILYPVEENRSFLFLIKSQKDFYREAFDFEKADKLVKEFLPYYDQYKQIIETTRLLAHGLLHLCGYKDKTPKDSALMRQKEEEMMLLFDQL